MKYLVIHYQPEDKAKEEIGIVRTKGEDDEANSFPSFREAKNFAIESLEKSIEAYREQIKRNQAEIKRVKGLIKETARELTWEEMDTTGRTIVEKEEEEEK